VSPRTLDTLPFWASELLRESRVGHLGLLDKDARPRVLPVTYVLFDGELWSAVDDKRKRRPGEELARVRWLRERPQSTLTVDRYDDDWSRLAWVQVLGSTAVIDAAGHAHVLDALAARYRPYRARRPPGPLLRLTPERALCWHA
jgi:PPOX class probable F420-dependent enzyme